MNSDTNKKFVATIVVVVAIALLGVVGSSLTKDNNSDNSASTAGDSSSTNTANTATATPAANSATTNTTTGSYKDGTYTESTSYQSPGGIEDIDVTITVADGTITSAEVKQVANNPDSEEYQSRFANNYKSKVVGKPLSSLSLSLVSGASLTTDGFNDALEAIRIKAEV
jgi:uncharacterized protein with FMN-binding domain